MFSYKLQNITMRVKDVNCEILNEFLILNVPAF